MHLLCSNQVLEGGKAPVPFSLTDRANHGGQAVASQSLCTLALVSLSRAPGTVEVHDT